MRALLCLFVLFAAGPASAGVAVLETPSEVRATVVNAMTEWVNKAAETTTCGAGDCCIAFANATCVAAGNPWPCCDGAGTGGCSNPNDGCTGPAAPVACCSGSNAGTCEDVACLAFAETIRLDLVGWADDVEAQLQFDGDWSCKTYIPRDDSNRTATVCPTVSGTPIIDVSRILTEFAARRANPVP